MRWSGEGRREKGREAGTENREEGGRGRKEEGGREGGRAEVRDGGEGAREENNTCAHTRHLYCSFTHKGSGGLPTIPYDVALCGLQCGLALGNQWKGLQC